MQNTKKCLTSFFHSLWGRLKSFETYLLISRSNFAKKTWFIVWRVSSIRSFVDYYPRDANINREYQIDCGLINTIDTRVTGFDSKGAQRISFPCPSNLQSGLFPSTIKNKTKSHLAGDRGNDSRDRENNKPNRRERWWTGAEIYETAADLQEDRARPRKIGLLDDTVWIYRQSVMRLDSAAR